jgi:hypothetical protein
MIANPLHLLCKIWTVTNPDKCQMRNYPARLYNYIDRRKEYATSRQTVSTIDIQVGEGR